MHGPLARVELGENKVQGIDYAYTLQGWMKGINSSQLDPNHDMGEDGIDITSPVSRDAYGFNLGYFNQDYSPIGGSNFEANYNPSGGSTFGDDSYKNGSLMDNGLYNGNIRHSVLAMDSLNFPNLGYIYRYDQLNRLMAQRAYNGLDTSSHEWTSAAVLEDYKENVVYDPNGNILTYERNATTNNGPFYKMDSLRYHYMAGTNMLDHVHDTIPASNYTEDIDEQDTLNYQYDAIGNLILDVAENVQYDWNNNGKLSFTFTATDMANYYYDPMGNRIETYTEHSGLGYDNLFHVRDAQGNIMATYMLTNGWEYKLKELSIYGSSRLGVLKADTVIFDFSTPTQPDFYSAWSGRKMYELTNHLGNVLSTVTDKKVLFDNDNDNDADWSIPEIATANDYYPFGMLMPGRNSDSTYRFGFNGKENLDAIKGEGKSQDFGARIYDGRLGRWLAVDALSGIFPGWSPYRAFLNNPIFFVDKDGNIEWPLKGTSVIQKNETEYLEDQSVYVKRTKTWIKQTGDFESANLTAAYTTNLTNPNADAIIRTSEWNINRKSTVSNPMTSPHIGTDFRASVGTQIYSLGDGEITALNRDNGNLSVTYGNGDVVTFRHLNLIGADYRVGSKVLEGEKIATTGERSTNTPHLHIEAVDMNGVSVNFENRQYGVTTNESFFNDYDGDARKLKDAKDKAIKALNDAGEN